MNLTDTRRMIGAEILKLRRSRGIIAFAVVLTVGVIVIAYVYTAIRHASDPLHVRPAGGTKGFTDGVQSLGDYFGMLAAILIGAEAGTLDRASGVFRDLVVTGRSRLALFAVRIPAALAVTWVLAGAGYALTVVATFAFSGGGPTPSLGLILQGLGWLLLADGVIATIAVGVGSVTGSRAISLTGLIGWQAILTTILLNVTSLGSARAGLVAAALDHLIPVPSGRATVVAMSTVTAVIVILAWTVALTVAGGWRTRTQDA